MTKQPIALTKKQAFALVDAVMDNDELAITASAYENKNKEWVFEASCDQQPDLEKFNQLASEILGGSVEFSSTQIDTKTDWVSKSLKGLKPVIAGGFYIYGSHDNAHEKTDLIEIEIEAAQAFGTGHHETTTGCLEAIEKTFKNSNPKSILDIGTGTGVLAIAAAKLTKETIIASDIDAIAVEITKENATLNNVEKQIFTIEATGVSHHEISKNAPYDLIIANILANPLQELAPEIEKISNTDATIILSGILETQAADVINTYQQHGFALKEHLIRAEWSTLILSK